jgi:hypothetical protein
MCRGTSVTGSGCKAVTVDGSLRAEHLSLSDAINEVTISVSPGTLRMFLDNLSYQQTPTEGSDGSRTSTASQPPSGGGSDWWPWILGGALLGGGAAAAVRIKIRGRKIAELEAENADPPEHCRPPQRYTQWKATIDPSRRHVDAIRLTASDPAGTMPNRISAATPETTHRLDLALRSYARASGSEIRKAEAELRAVSASIVAEMSTWLAGEAKPLTVTVAIRLVGGKIATNFTRYHCAKKARTKHDPHDEGAWQKVTSWKGALAAERVLPPAGLKGFRSDAATVADAGVVLARHVLAWGEALRS